jgi:hypothetical protein
MTASLGGVAQWGLDNGRDVMDFVGWRRLLGVMVVLMTGCQGQGFFSRLTFFLGRDQNCRLPRNLGNLAYFLIEIIQTNFEFKNFICQNKKKSYLSNAIHIT